MTALEKDIERALGRMVGRLGGMAMKWVSPGWSGVPDRVILMPGGVVCFVEVKRPHGGREGAMQIWWAKRLQELGFEHRFIKNHAEITALERWLVEQMEAVKDAGN